MYEQVTEMARSQHEFNSMIKDTQDSLSEPFENQIQDLRKQNVMLNHELERTQDQNRVMLSDFDFFKNRKSSPRSSSISINLKKDKKLLNDSRYSFYGTPSVGKFPSTASNSRKSRLILKNPLAQFKHERIGTSGYSSKKLKRFKLFSDA